MRQDQPGGEPLTIPSAFLRNSDRNSFVVGKVILSQNSKDAVWPMKGGTVASEEDCLLFLRILRKWFVPDAEEVWAIMSAPSSGRTGEAERLAQLAGLVFERALVVPGLTLSALTLMNEWKRDLKASTLLDLGASSIQAALVSGAWPEPNEIVHFEGGGNLFDLRLVNGINELFPGLSVSIANVRRLKELYGRVGTEPVAALVQVTYRGHRKIVDLGPTIFESLSTLSETVADAVTQVLGDPRGERAQMYGREVIFTGGGARTPGLRTAVHKILRERGYHTEKIAVPAHMDELVVRGGRHLSHLVSETHWEVLT